MSGLRNPPPPGGRGEGVGAAGAKFGGGAPKGTKDGTRPRAPRPMPLQSFFGEATPRVGAKKILRKEVATAGGGLARTLSWLPVKPVIESEVEFPALPGTPPVVSDPASAAAVPGPAVSNLRSHAGDPPSSHDAGGESVEVSKTGETAEGGGNAEEVVGFRGKRFVGGMRGADVSHSAAAPEESEAPKRRGPRRPSNNENRIPVGDGDRPEGRGTEQERPSDGGAAQANVNVGEKKRRPPDGEVVAGGPGTTSAGSAPQSGAAGAANPEDKRRRKRKKAKKKNEEQPTSRSVQVWDASKFEKYKNAGRAPESSAQRVEPAGPAPALSEDAFAWPALGDEVAVDSGRGSQNRDGSGRRTAPSEVVGPLNEDDQWVDITEPWIQRVDTPNEPASSARTAPGLSYSSVVKAVVAEELRRVATGDGPCGPSTLAAAADKKKRRRRKKKPGAAGDEPNPAQKNQQPQAPGPPKRVEPIKLDLGAFIERASAKSKLTKRQKLQQQPHPGPGPASAKRGAQHPAASASQQHQRHQRVVANILDSTAPRIRRGKEREKPKAKKKTRLKRLILAERVRLAALRRSLRELKWDDAVVTPVVEVGAEPAVAEGRREVVDVEKNDGQEHQPASPETVDTVPGLPAPGKDLKEKRLEAMRSLAEACRKPESHLHSKKFREYCDNVVTDQVNEHAVALIRELMRFQDRLHQKDPSKARIKRRIVYGLRECLKHAGLKRVKAVLIAPDLERVEGPGGLNAMVGKVKELAAEYNFPVIACLHRRKFGYVCLKRAPLSAVAILDYSGADPIFKSLVAAYEAARDVLEDRRREVQAMLEGGEFAVRKSGANLPLAVDATEEENEAVTTLCYGADGGEDSNDEGDEERNVACSSPDFVAKIKSQIRNLPSFTM